MRQCPYHYAIRAGQNLPDKEFRYLRTVIVTAAVHRGFSSKRKPLPLTFRHRAGVSPYTSTFVLAQTYVFGKQLHGLLSCGPLTLSTTMEEYLGSAFFSIFLNFNSENLNVNSDFLKKKTGFNKLLLRLSASCEAGHLVHTYV